ncbi:hypothetical protein [Pseudomonas rhodesiae]|uniref:hypothetical protein n=1 Tax=Pseudomonas rhodesiae TaxID=76760 RepID=UPI00058C5BDA|nr:hypothetical protein [Pseudomonas rhodesiae]
MIFFFDPKLREVRAWSHSEIEGLCFFITIRCMHTGQQNRAAVVNCAYELRHYIQAAKDVEIIQVQMMCPPSVSGLSGWILEELDSVVIYSGIDTHETAVVYRTHSKSYKLGELDLRKRKKSRKLYSANYLSTHTPEKSEERTIDNDAHLYSSFGIST